MSDIKKIKDEYLGKLSGELNLEDVNQIKTELFGKNGLISLKFKTIGSIPETDRKKICIRFKSSERWTFEFDNI